MVLEILKNNYKGNGENYYNKNKKHQKKNKGKINVLDDDEYDNENDDKNVDSANNSELCYLYEIYKNGFNKEENNGIILSHKNNKKGLIYKNKINALYDNSKEMLHYRNQENEENDIFEEDIYENDNFDDNNFVEEENVEYKTYNSFTNEEANMLNNYSRVNIKNILDSHNINKRELYNKHNNNNGDNNNANKKKNDQKNFNKDDSNIREYSKNNNITRNLYKKNLLYFHEKYNEKDKSTYEYHIDACDNFYEYGDEYNSNHKSKGKNIFEIKDVNIDRKGTKKFQKLDKNKETTKDMDYDYYDEDNVDYEDDNVEGEDDNIEDEDDNIEDEDDNIEDEDDNIEVEDDNVDDEDDNVDDEDDNIDDEDDNVDDEDDNVDDEDDNVDDEDDNVDDEDDHISDEDYKDDKEDNYIKYNENDNVNDDEDNYYDEEENNYNNDDNYDEEIKDFNKYLKNNDKEESIKNDVNKELSHFNFNNDLKQKYIDVKGFKNENIFNFKNIIKEDNNTLKREELFSFGNGKKLYNREENKIEVATFGMCNKNEWFEKYDVKIENCKKYNNYKNENNDNKNKNPFGFKGLDKHIEEKEEYDKMYMDGNNYMKGKLIGNISPKIQRSHTDNNIENYISDSENMNTYNIMNEVNRVLPYNNINNNINNNNNNNKLIYNQGDTLNSIEHTNNISKYTTVDYSNDILKTGKETYKELTKRKNEEICELLNSEDKKKHNIKHFLDKMKSKKHIEDFFKKEDKICERSEKKEKLKIKFTDILHAGAFGHFFHRNKNGLSRSFVSSDVKRNNSFNSINKINKKDQLKYNTLEKYETKIGAFDESKLGNVRNDKTVSYNQIECKNSINYNSKTELNIDKNKDFNFDKNKWYKMNDNEEKIHFLKFPNGLLDNDKKKELKSNDNGIDDKLLSYVEDVKYKKYNDMSKQKNGIPKQIVNNRRNMINKDYYEKKYNIKVNRNNEENGVDEKMLSVHGGVFNKNDFEYGGKIKGIPNFPLNIEFIKQNGRYKEKGNEKYENDLEVNIDQTLSRKMLENNKLKKQNNIDEDIMVTPFYIKSKIDKVLKNNEIFEKSARATFQQFDVKNKNFLHFSEIESLIQKLCHNLELPPVDKNILSIVYKDYDSSKNNRMNYTDFRQMYWDLLKQIKKKYYPTKNFKIKRNCIISRKKLGGYDYSSIYNYLSFKKILGYGAFGEVHLVEDNICKLYKVVKILKKKSMKHIKINEEINVLIYLDHPNIIKIFDVYENVDCTYIVMELCEGGELMSRIKNSESFNETYIKNIMFQILCAIAYMHSNNIAHKDLKPENILFKEKGDDTLKIIDFGLAELINKSEGISKTAAGTVLYMAPEVFKKKFTIKCDIWSAGVIMFFLFTKSLPFGGNTYDEVKQSIFRDEPDYKSLKSKLSQTALHMLKLMLQKDYNKRPMASVLLHHPWFQGYFDPIQISPNVLNNMKSYMKHSNIRNIIINIMAHELSVINNHIKYINELFYKLDTNHNGSLSHREIYTVLASVGIKKWDINRILQALDINDRGNITYTEFMAGCYRWKNIESTFLKAAFNKIDKDEDGYISKSDIVSLVHDKVLDNNDIDNFFLSVHSIKKGIPREHIINKISFQEFKDYMLSTF
ncbi:calcium-dependent protein kinase 6 [Plasmodium falciparum NF54]|uniref:non-specific serine/threonine protein kinase n=2 Tax=Plasmodium falciparum TaxID=5833 RepID=Q8IID5_PLAF7|nr:calcium-dependent protein kinase 6 [Plasmodium falciparum 3D7]KAF4331136.1 calcium-dependent protein kinase 6 [Plasmodium falciparum NF54]PKC49223.1 calcium-dependent protein kinase 6 [Plasmodium falciparum NF54]CZT98890.1 calcium-dependent protein kinase 6 [Plasmodium falciparum 3D7]|eukprot:XP_001347910.1 calcium-dependent protein kinase 6 [Plasmodium falciparum 3D7]